MALLGREQMEIDGLRLPDLLTSMIETGRWPSTNDSINKQNLQSLIPSDRNRKLRAICLYPPPFRTLANAKNDDFYRKSGVIWQLKPERAIEIADFGLGADSPILLYYNKSKTEPIVINLDWQMSLDWQEGASANSWGVMADSFSDFVEILGI